MATLTVTTAADVVNAGDGLLSLREAVAQANATAAADTILFASVLEGKKLVLTGGQLQIDRNLSIDGDQNNDGTEVSIGSGNTSRIMRIDSGSSVSLTDLTLTEAFAGDYVDGGAIYLGSGRLSLNNCTITDSRAGVNLYDGRGGAIFAGIGTQVYITDSTISNNVAGPSGGAIHAEYGASVTIRRSTIAGNEANYGGAIDITNGRLVLETSRFQSNLASGYEYGSGGAISITDSSAVIIATSFISNICDTHGGAIYASDSILQIDNSTFTANRASGFEGRARGGAVYSSDGMLSIFNSTVTGNKASAYFADALGGGVWSNALELQNSIISGNEVTSVYGGAADSDVSGRILLSNGHNIFGSDVLGNVSGDRENIAASAIFASIDPATGGGVVSASGIVPLRNNIANPALSGADPLAAAATGQLGTTGRPLPAGSLPDIGSVEINQPLSTIASAYNDVLTGTASANTINGLAGADFIKGLGGADTLRGGEGGDLLDGGVGNDRLYGDAGIDLVFYGGTAKVTVDLSLATDKAFRGGETDTLYNVEGAIGSSGADTFRGNEYNNFFQGGAGKDTCWGGSGRDLYDFNAVPDSRAGSGTRDVIRDFDHLVDKLDLMGIDADTALAGNQAFRWVGTAPLTGAGQLGFFTSGDDTIVRASNDADTASELEIQLTGYKPLTAADFYL